MIFSSFKNSFPPISGHKQFYKSRWDGTGNQTNFSSDFSSNAERTPFTPIMAQVKWVYYKMYSIIANYNNIGHVHDDFDDCNGGNANDK